jgi:hypothetical protein
MIKEPAYREGCTGCSITQATFGNGIEYVLDQTPGTDIETLHVPGLGLSEGVVLALGLFRWQDETQRVDQSQNESQDPGYVSRSTRTVGLEFDGYWICQIEVALTGVTISQSEIP